MINKPGDNGTESSAELETLRFELQQRDDILAMAAHELRNPLHALTMQMALARSTAEAHDQTDVVSRIRKAEATLGRYSDRVTVLMDLMSGNAADYPLALRSFDLAATLSALVESLSPDARFRGVDIRMELAAACMVVGDATVIEQVVDNLLINALKHAACSVVTVRLRCVGDEVEIEVEDNGRGIAPEDQQRVFSKFIVAQQGQRGSGTGLGLWIVRKLLATVHGEIALRSEPQVGTVFTLRFPMTQTIISSQP